MAWGGGRATSWLTDIGPGQHGRGRRIVALGQGIHRVAGRGEDGFGEGQGVGGLHAPEVVVCGCDVRSGKLTAFLLPNHIAASHRPCMLRREKGG
jgi:hypothetical protein